MLRLHPEKRAKAADLKHHRWLEDIVVQGEIDVIRRMEQDEAAKRKAVESRSRATSRDKEDGEERKRMAALDQSERDAMKPVDESVLVVNGDEVILTTARQEYWVKICPHVAPPMWESSVMSAWIPRYDLATRG